MKYALLLMMLVSTWANAGYKGEDIKEMGKAPSTTGELVRIYDVGPSVEFFNKNPECMDRLHATYTNTQGQTESACWWAFGERMFFWSESKGTMELNTNFVLKNDNYVPLLKRTTKSF